MATRCTLRPSDLVKWESKDEQIVARYVQRLMDILSVGEGEEVSTTQLFKLDAYLRILSGTVGITGVEDLESKRSLIGRSAFRRLKRYRKQSLAAFRGALAAEARRHIQGSTAAYCILFPLHISPTQLKRFRWFTVLGTRLTVRSWNRVRSDFDLEGFLQDAVPPMDGLTISLEADFTPMMATVRGRDSHEAFREASRAFELFRALLSLRGQFGLTYRRFGFHLKPLGNILPPPVYGVFGSDGAYLEYWYNTARYDRYDTNRVRVEDILSARKLARRFGVSIRENETMALVVGAVQKYGEALAIREWGPCFLLFWQILELLTLQTSGLNMRQVTNRICALLGGDQLVADLLRVLYDTRNEFVHLGRFTARDEVGLIEVNLLKYVVDRSLAAMIGKMGRLQSKSSLEKFYAHATEPSAALAERARVIGHIERDRAKRANA
jgi:hypothetical protein